MSGGERERLVVEEAGSGEPSPETEAVEAEEKPRLGRNTWPRKRHVRSMAHVAALFDGDGEGDSVVAECGMVSVDDSVCDGRGRLTEEYSLSRAGSVQRILRNSRNPLPPGESECIALVHLIGWLIR